MHAQIMKLTIAAWLLIGSAFTILIGIFLGISFFNTIQRHVEEAEWVKEKNETLDQLLTLEKLLVDIETGQRAYRSTNEKRFLSSLNQAQINIGLVEDNLTNSFRENSPKLAQLAQIQQSVQSLVQLWSSTSENDSGLNRQSLIEITALEKKEMDNVRMLVKKIYTAERYELSKREASIKTLIENLTRKTVLGTFLLFLVAAVLTYFYALEFKSRKKIENQLSKNVEELEELNHSIKERSWYLAGLTVLNDALQNINTLEALGQSALKSITDYLELPAGGMYILDESEKLALKASVALSAQVSQSYALGEGLVGQAALERQIRITKFIPSSYRTIESGSGATNAGEIACIPLWYGKELKGVIELASFSPFPDHHIELLKKVSKDISLSVNEIQSRLKVGRLLEQLKEQKAILENQQDELRQTNEELSHQTESRMACD